MKSFVLILSLHFAVFSTQPVWQPLAQWLSSGGCGQVCEVQFSCSPSEPQGQSCPPGEDGQPIGCCAPFQCCFPCCCFCNTVEQFSISPPFAKKIRPAETTDPLFSQFSQDHFQPPELPAFG